MKDKILFIVPPLIRFIDFKDLWSFQLQTGNDSKALCDGDEKFLVQGLILVAAGLVHYQKDEDGICISIFNRALAKLEKSSGKYHNIDIDKIKKTVTYMINSKEVSSFLI